MKAIYLVGLVSLAALAWILVQTPSAEAALGTITVTVQDYQGNPLPDAYVCLENATRCYQARTDGNGRATFSNMRLLDTYRLNVTYLGIKNVRVFENWNYSNPAHPKTFRTGVFNVRICVRSSGGIQPIQGASLEIRSTLTDPDVNLEQTTGADGCATFPRLPGNGTLYTYNATFNHQVFGVRIATGETNLNLDVNSFDDNLIDLPLYRLRLTLRDRADRPVQGLETRLWRGEKSGSPQMTASSDSSGVVVFSLLPEGRYIYDVVYKGDVLFTVPSPENINSNRDRPPVKLPLTRLSVEVYDLKNKPLSSYTAPSYELTARLYADANLYFEARERGGVISVGYVYDERDYRLILLFEGQEVFSGILRSDDIKTGTVRVQARFGDFSLSLDSSGFFGTLPRILQRASIRLEAGNYRVEERLGGEGVILLRDKPLVKYSYTILLDGVNIGSGEITPAHGEPRQLRPKPYRVSALAVSLDDKPIAGSLKLIYGGESIGTVNLPREGASIEGLLKLSYSYSFTYMDVEVARGEVRPEEVEAGLLNIRASVADVKAKLLDNTGEESLAGAIAALYVASYRQEGLADEEGVVSFSDAPLTTATLSIHYQGIRVYSSPVTYSPEQRLLEIRGTGVYTISFTVLDGEGEPLTDTIFKMNVGSLSVARTMKDDNVLTLKLVPNGTLSLSLEYMGVNVFTGSHRPLRNGENVEITAKVYPLRLEVYFHGSAGKDLLDGARLHVDLEGRRLATLEARRGVAEARLPAGNYLVLAEYKGSAVADRVLALTGSQKIVIETSVFGVSLKVLKLNGSPAANLSLRLVKEGDGETLEGLTTDEAGSASTLLPTGIYKVVYGEGERMVAVRLPVNTVSSYTLLYGETWSNYLYPLIAAPALGAVSIYCLYSSFRLKSQARRSRTLAEEGKGVREWARRGRERLRKNV